jgi:hypothetical protein
MAIWEKTNNSLICQGDRLNSIAAPLIHHSFPQVDSDGSVPVDVQPMDVIILTQSCELENSKASLVVVAGVYTIEDFEELNASFQSTGRWESVQGPIRWPSPFAWSRRTDKWTRVCRCGFSSNSIPSGRICAIFCSKLRRTLALRLSLPREHVTSLRTIFHARSVAYRSSTRFRKKMNGNLQIGASPISTLPAALRQSALRRAR